MANIATSFGMVHTRILIVQLLGIFMLICGYFLSDQPDSLSVMHFDPNPLCPSVFTKAVKSTPYDVSFQDPSHSSTNNNRKTNVPKFVSYEVILPQPSVFYFHRFVPLVHTLALHNTYSYLFFEEINPPPPKGC